jgi:hypothetical protein
MVPELHPAVEQARIAYQEGPAPVRRPYPRDLTGRPAPPEAPYPDAPVQPLDPVLQSPADELPDGDYAEPPADGATDADALQERLRIDLEHRLQALAGEAADLSDRTRKPAYPCLEDRLLKVSRVIRSFRDNGPDVDCQLKTMGGFVRYCLTHLCEDEMPPIRKAVRGFLDDLKERNS